MTNALDRLNSDIILTEGVIVDVVSYFNLRLSRLLDTLLNAAPSMRPSTRVSKHKLAKLVA